MKIYERRLPKTERYPCTKRQAKAALAGAEVNWIGFGWPSRHFEFDSRATHRPTIRGTVVAHANYSPQREAYVCIHVLRKDDYSAEAQEDFLGRVLPHLRRWLDQQAAKPDTAMLSYQELIAAWDGTAHRFYEMTLHTGLSGRPQRKEEDVSSCE